MRPIALSLLALGLLATSPARAQDEVPLGPDAPNLQALLEWASRTADPPIRFLSPGGLEGQPFQLVSPRPIARSEIVGAVRTILRSRGYVLIHRGREASWEVYEVVRDAQARWEPCPIVTVEGLAGHSDSEVVTCVVRLEHADPRDVQGALKLARVSHPQLGNIIAFESTRTIAITDYVDLVRTLVRMIEILDVPASAPATQGALAVSLRAYLFPGSTLEDAPRVVFGPDAARVATAARERSAEAILEGSSGQLLRPASGAASHGYQVRHPKGGELLLAARLVQNAPIKVEGQGVATLLPPRLDVAVEISTPTGEDGAVAQFSHEVALPPARGSYAVVQGFRRGDAAWTLVLVVEVEE